MDDTFCLANGWELNRSPEELYKWWLKCINNVAEDFIRMGIQFNLFKAGVINTR